MKYFLVGLVVTPFVPLIMLGMVLVEFVQMIGRNVCQGFENRRDKK